MAIQSPFKALAHVLGGLAGATQLSRLILQNSTTCELSLASSALLLSSLLLLLLLLAPLP